MKTTTTLAILGMAIAMMTPAAAAEENPQVAVSTAGCSIVVTDVYTPPYVFVYPECIKEKTRVLGPEL